MSDGWASPRPVAAGLGEAPVLRISVENNPRHFQVRALRHFAEDAERNLAGRLRIEVHDSASLYRDSDVLQALQMGSVEMALPGAWALHGTVPDCGLFMLPIFYGAPARSTRAVVDGIVGRIIDARIERSLNVVVLGRWMELGHANLYLVNRRVNSPDDMEGLRIRLAGGPVNELRLAAMGAHPQVVPWPDLPQWLGSGKLDGVVSTNETVVSGQLWQDGITHAFEDNAYFAMYVPMVSRVFWDSLPEDVRRTLRRTWEQHVDEGRALAAFAQREAREELRARGVTFVTPDAEDLRRWRWRLQANELEMADFVGVDPMLYEMARKESWRAEQYPQPPVSDRPESFQHIP